MNKSSVEEILRESRAKRKKNLEIKKVNTTSDVEMQDNSKQIKKRRNYDRNENINRRFDDNRRFKQNKFKNKRVIYFL
jgi:hypothetical protein